MVPPAAAVGAALVGSPLEGVILIFLFSLSKALEAYAMGRTRHAIARLMDLVDDPGDQQAIVHAAKMFYRLYGEVFRSLPLPVTRRSLEDLAA